MKRLIKITANAVTATFLLVTCPQILAADEQSSDKLTLHPAAEPKPALKYRLLPPITEQIPGNAAVDYGKVTAENFRFFTSVLARESRDKIDLWQDMPLEQLRSEKVAFLSSSLYFLEQGARRRYCDWQLPIGDEPFYTIILPEAQQGRAFARMLAVKARFEIANGKFDEAVKTFQTNYALARHMSQGETLVNGLVGIGLGGIMFPQVLEFIQQPGAPNLYWALSTLPTPLIDVRKAIDVESSGLELSFPELRQLETSRRSPEEWRELFHRVATQLTEWTATGDANVQRPSPAELDKTCEDLLPTATRALVDRGISPETVDAMSLHQVALLYTVRLRHELFDEAAKSYFLPYPQAIQGLDAAIARAEQTQQIIPVASQNLTSIRPTRWAIMGSERQIAVLRVLEALRIHAASHEGNLPEQLSDITEVPVPNDPATGEPFNYLRDGHTAILQAPRVPDIAQPIIGQRVNYEITMVRAAR
jgi:hypothetical protein